MVSCEELFRTFRKFGFNFYTGIPCSIFKDWINFIVERKDTQHVIGTSEGETIAIATGYYLASKDFPVVYMQNSGLGNSVNPLTSLTAPEVFGIPFLLLISWRGEPRLEDEPEHKKMGKITTNILDTLHIPYSIMPDNIEGIEATLGEAKRFMQQKSTPYAILIGKGTIGKYDKVQKKIRFPSTISREEAIKLAADKLHKSGLIVSTTGKISRELFEYIESTRRNHQNIFYTVGSMGCSTGIALGLALRKKKKKIFLFDGDGACLMKLGSMATVGHYFPANFFHILFDNQCYDSTGGQPTVSKTVDFVGIAESCNYRYAELATSHEELEYSLNRLIRKRGPYMLVAKVKSGARDNLGRPTIKPQENKEKFIDFIKE